MDESLIERLEAAVSVAQRNVAAGRRLRAVGRDPSIRLYYAARAYRRAAELLDDSRGPVTQEEHQVTAGMAS